MPKTLIRGRHDAQTDAYIRLGWSKESEHVQLATAVPTGVGKVSLWDAKEGRWIDTDSIEDHGWFIQLDRSTINQLIRELRKARDQAFGADA